QHIEQSPSGVGAPLQPGELALGARALTLGGLPALEQTLAADHRDPLARHEQGVAARAKTALVGGERRADARRALLGLIGRARGDPSCGGARRGFELVCRADARLALRVELLVGDLLACGSEPPLEVGARLPDQLEPRVRVAAVLIAAREAQRGVLVSA